MSFPASGSTQKAGLIVMRIDDTVGRDVDPRLRGALVVLNATPDRQTQQVNGLLGHHLTLSPVQARGADPVARTTTWDDASGTVSVPARTAVVLVER
ncbi:hypothetical protein GCM10025868_33280 [Angustibacter aerolatus]|uniref:Alpha-1,6-glucosidases pullulanase-type C-terminal domain-containing protein n=1 Tax=Angustibacter aerolatus TaxID=1162965 RepID=A0ABQ6JIR2_9ACTN|nr:alpha-1,6-glucosidase domain-containing protein [Angustibacter aerolatus]GMA88078.1 hypothetical protein GCM10025868_33280 [Angustibacter aerolatus]